jgi:hypothetical protein
VEATEVRDLPDQLNIKLNLIVPVIVSENVHENKTNILQDILSSTGNNNDHADNSVVSVKGTSSIIVPLPSLPDTCTSENAAVAVTPRSQNDVPSPVYTPQENRQKR